MRRGGCRGGPPPAVPPDPSRGLLTVILLICGAAVAFGLLALFR